MKYLTFFLLVLNIKNSNCIPGLWGINGSAMVEMFFKNNIQFSVAIDGGFFCPFGKRYVCSLKNIESSFMKYCFLNGVLSWNLNDFYIHNLELDTFSVSFGVQPIKDINIFQKPNNYKLSFFFDFKKFFIELRFISSSLNPLKKNDILRCIGIAIGRNFPISEGKFNFSISGICIYDSVKLSRDNYDNLINHRNKDLSLSDKISLNPINRYKIDEKFLDMPKEVRKMIDEVRSASIFNLLTTNQEWSETIEFEYKNQQSYKITLYQINRKIHKLENDLSHYLKNNKKNIEYIKSKFKENRNNNDFQDDFLNKINEILKLMQSVVNQQIVDYSKKNELKNDIDDFEKLTKINDKDKKNDEQKENIKNFQELYLFFLKKFFFYYEKGKKQKK